MTTDNNVFDDLDVTAYWSEVSLAERLAPHLSTLYRLNETTKQWVRFDKSRLVWVESGATAQF